MSTHLLHRSRIRLPGNRKWNDKAMGTTQIERLRMARVTFLPMLAVIRQLRQGEVWTVQGRPVMRSYDGRIDDIAPMFLGWASCWERIARNEGLTIDTRAIEIVGQRLGSSTPLTADDVERCARALQHCYGIYLTLPFSALESHIRTEQIAIELEALASPAEAPQ